MAENSKIEWTDHTWSPVWGCTQVSKAETGGGGCDNCYAMELAHRFGTGWNGAPMREFGDKHWATPLRWNRQAKASGAQPKVFPSMCDPLDKDWPDAVRERFWRLVDATPYLTWLILTKRIGNAERLGPGAVIGRWPANVWLGATVVNQAEADRDIPKLLDVPAVKRFLSIEPMLGPVDLTKRLPGRNGSAFGYCGFGVFERGVDWVIVGGESGRGRDIRPMHPQWARDLRDQCAQAGVPFLFKQHGEWREPLEGERFDTSMGGAATPPAFIVSKDNGTVHCFHSSYIVDGQAVIRVGKKVAGRLLDGITHDGFPAPGAAPEGADA